jgi:leader peptidase (prepilin peptidase)/N-methyltransferase
MPDPVAAIGAALLAGLAVLVGTAPLLRRLPEPHADDPGADRKIRYDRLATPRFVLGVTAVATAAALVGWASMPPRLQPLWMVLATVGVLLAAIDAVTTWLPRRLTYLGWLAMLAAAGLSAALGAGADELLRGVLGGLVAGLVYWLIWTLTRGGFGFGDVRFAPLLGTAAAAHSWALLAAALLLGSVLGAVHGLLRLLQREPAEFPYAPSMLAGTYLAALTTWWLG